jgi:hypothetical protein
MHALKVFRSPVWLATRIDTISGIDETLLDPVLVSEDCDCRFVEVIDTDKTISDHKATKLYLKIPDVIHKSYQRLVWIYKKGDFVKFNNLISQFDWYKLLYYYMLGKIK